MICFQFQFFLSLIPTKRWFQKCILGLWFAFNFSSFYLWYQLQDCEKAKEDSCDLLSISVLSIFDTNLLWVINKTGKLWFAFNFSSFYLWYQHSISLILVGIGCDLLSISVLSIFDTNSKVFVENSGLVVICFQFQFFLSLIPTWMKLISQSIQLWFAFNFSSFYLWYQQPLLSRYDELSCDLLSISVLSIFDTNNSCKRPNTLQVVICFQFQFFLSLIPTTIMILGITTGCDLLSISVLSIFDTNGDGAIVGDGAVVICFQFQFFLSLIPT